MRVTVKLKLAMAFGAIILLSAGTAVISVNGLSTLNSALDDVVNGPAKRVELSLKLSNALLALVRVEKNLITATAQDDIARFDNEVLDKRRELLGLIDAGLADASTEDRPQWAEVKDAVQKYATVQDRIQDLVRRGLRDQAVALSVGEARQHVLEAEKQAGDVVDLNHQRMNQAKVDAGGEYENARSELIGAVLIALLIAAGTGTWISFSISRGLARAGSLAQAVANGDLTGTIDDAPRDEIGDLIGHVNNMVLRLRTVVAEALSAADNVSAGSQELSASAEELSQGAT
ncbi:MCP four helix bundle domain-containing protein, partial [Tistlia consotensis]